MPFDSRREVEVVAMPEAAHAIDRILEVLGPEGERWIQGVECSWSPGVGNQYCVMGAVQQERGYIALPFIIAAVGLIARGTKIHKIGGARKITHYNDGRQRKFKHIKAVLLKARELAMEAR